MEREREAEGEGGGGWEEGNGGTALCGRICKFILGSEVSF